MSAKLLLVAAGINIAMETKWTGKVEGRHGGVQKAHRSSLGPVPDLPPQEGRKQEEREGSHWGRKEPAKWSRDEPMKKSQKLGWPEDTWKIMMPQLHSKASVLLDHKHLLSHFQKTPLYHTPQCSVYTSFEILGKRVEFHN